MNVAAPALRKICTSPVNYWLAFAFDAGTAFVLPSLGAYYLDEWPEGPVPTAINIAFFFGMGVFVFTFVEYAMHRWLYHARTGFAAESHHEHHVSPRGPSAMPCPCGSIGITILWWLVMPTLGRAGASFFIGGMAIGYLYYGVLHHLEHHVRAASVPGGWPRERWKVHAVHHGWLDRNFGVTTSLWDHVFGTYRKI